VLIKDVIPEGLLSPDKINFQNVPTTPNEVLSPKEFHERLTKLRQAKLRRVAVYQQNLALNQAANSVNNSDWLEASRLNQVPIADRFRPNPHPELGSNVKPRPLGRDKRP
jgi:hypothetical protein